MMVASFRRPGANPVGPPVHVVARSRRIFSAATSAASWMSSVERGRPCASSSSIVAVWSMV
jgi:hypothetical protein